MKLSFAAFLMAVLTVQGCGGGEGCGAGVGILVNGRYAGSYTATYTASAQGEPPISFDFTIDGDGLAEGTLTDAGDVSASTVRVRVGDVGNGCSKSGTALNVDLMSGADVSATVGGFREIRNTLVGSYQGTLSTRERFSQGTLTVSKTGG